LCSRTQHRVLPGSGKVSSSVYPENQGTIGNNSNLLLKGKSLYSLLERLVPNLNGNATLEEITEELDADRKRMITNLLEKLFAHDFLKDISQDKHHTLHPLERETLRRRHDCLSQFIYDPGTRRFDRDRNAIRDWCQTPATPVLRAGDSVEVEIEPIGMIRNQMVAEARSQTR
jgi:hypothetical protein